MPRDLFLKRSYKHMPDAAGRVMYILDSETGGQATIELDITGAKSAAALQLDVSAAATGPIIDINVSAAATGAIFDIDLTAVATGDIFNFASTAAYAGDVFDITLTNCAAGVQAMVITTSATARTANLIDITEAGAATGHILAMTTSAAFAGDAINVTLTGAAAGVQALVVQGSSTTRTAHLVELIEAGTPSGDTINISHGGASTGDAIHINQANAVGGRALNLDGSGTRTVPLVDIDTTGADTAYVETIDIAGAATRGGIAITTAAVGEAASNAAAGIHISGTGDLAASSDLVRIVTTGNISSTSNVLAIEQSTGAGTAGAFGLYVNCTGTNVEGIKVDAGDVVFDEDLTVTGSLILNGTETIAAGGTSTALDLSKTFHHLDADAGGDIFTVADGVTGQIIVCTMESSTGTATITPTNLEGGTSVTFNGAGDSVILGFIDSQWYILGGNSYGVT